MMDDVISRQTAIEAILSIGHKAELSDGDAVIRVSAVNYVLRIMPSAQPKKRTEERTETHGVCLDAIDRQVAIDTLHDEIVRRRINEDSIDDGALDEFDTEAILRRLPPAQPEIVRCKDCKYNSNTCGNYVNCDIIPQMFGRTTDNFCSMAKRKEGTDESD